jgi:eukaryotic translation initiation factor 2C
MKLLIWKLCLAARGITPGRNKSTENDHNSLINVSRFYPTTQDAADDKGNPKPGTVVDRGVTAIYEFDFYLQGMSACFSLSTVVTLTSPSFFQAHGGLQGTTRPTHYYVIHDEIGFSADQIQTLTNSVSYLFARATKAVSLVSPAYYADLACERGRCYLHKLLQGISDDNATVSTSSSDDKAVFQEATKMWHDGVHEKLKDTMFYL